jgi:tetratricopeptide (TPR) repeat protein
MSPLVPAALFALTGALAAFPALGQRQPTPAPAAEAAPLTYAACMDQARSQPMRVLPTAQHWARNGGGPPARHCAAIAQLGVGQYVEAATTLEALGRELTDRPAAERAELFAQAGAAWLEARDVKKAVGAYTAGLVVDARNAEIWVDRGIAYAAGATWREAASDFTKALTLSPGRPDVLTLRAAAWRNSGDLPRARADVDSALAIDPNNPDALLERGAIKLAQRDKPGADADFRRALRLVPTGSPSAKRAQDGLRSPAGSTGSGESPRPRR